MSTKKSKNEEPNAMEEITIPQGITIKVDGTTVTTKGSLGSNMRNFNDSLISVHATDKVTIDAVHDKVLRKKAGKVVKSFGKELRNDIYGVNNYFEKKLKIVFAHFPINVEVKGDMFYINNIIGERVPRISKIVGSTKIEAKGQNVRVYGTSIDDVSQTAANIRSACKIRNKDSRVFQDGLYYDVE